MSNYIDSKINENVIRLAKSNPKANETSSRSHDLKSVLIITSSVSEPPHFMKCIIEKMCSFVRDPIYLVDEQKADPKSCSKWNTSERMDHFILKKVDTIGESHLCNCEQPSVLRLFLRKYDMLIFTLYAGAYKDWNDTFVNVVNGLVERKEMALLFLRGSGKSAPMKLGYVFNPQTNDGFVDFVTGTNVQLMADNILNVRSYKDDNLTNFFNKYRFSLKTVSEEKNCLALEDPCICGLVNNALVKEDDWHFLARGVPIKERNTWLLHKTKRVMFTPWYGFSHGSSAQHDLTLYSLKFLLLDHLRESSNEFKRNLKLKLSNNQLTDFKISTVD